MMKTRPLFFTACTFILLLYCIHENNGVQDLCRKSMCSDTSTATQFGLCSGSLEHTPSGECTELESGQCCFNDDTHLNVQPAASRSNIGACVSIPAARKNNDYCQDRGMIEECKCTPECNNNYSENLQLQFNHTLQPVLNQDKFIVNLTWSRPVGFEVSGYKLLIAENSVSGCLDIHKAKCVADLDNETLNFNFMDNYGNDDTTQTTLYIMLIPNGWNSGPYININIPKTCYNLCPGQCEICSNSKVSIALATRDKPDTDVSVCKDTAETMMAHVSWTPKESNDMYYPDISETLYMNVEKKLMDGTNRSVSKFLTVKGKNSVTLRNLTLPVGDYRIKGRRKYCGCCDLFLWIKHEFRVGTDVTQCTLPTINTATEYSTSDLTSTSTIRDSSIINPTFTSTLTPLNISSTPTQISMQTTINRQAMVNSETRSIIRSITFSNTQTPPNDTPGQTKFEISTQSMPSNPITLKVHSTTQTILLVPTMLSSTSDTSRISSKPNTFGTPEFTISTNLNPNSNQLFSILTAILVVILIVVIIMTVIVVLIMKTRKHRYSKDSSQSSSEDGYMYRYSPHGETNVTIIMAQSSSIEEKMCILENVVKELSYYKGVTVEWYDKSRGIGASAWVERNISMCPKVLLVCNQSFIQEWKEPNSEMILDGPIVHAVKQHIQGDINSTKNYCEKYGLVFLKVEDIEDIPGGYLKNCTKFVVDPGNPDKLKEIVHFVLGVQAYILPSRTSVSQNTVT